MAECQIIPVFDNHFESFIPSNYLVLFSMSGIYPFTQIALLIGAAVIAVGLVVLMKQRQTGKKSKRGTKKAVKEMSASSPAIVRKVATGTGSVKTPGGRRSARIARKSLEHDD